ncbi:OmpA family protein [uncultured Maribacter sp.]|uniref:OmpA family protein n=1 Tax=uncultured Maribacter sp. TaxID=431308 RepID=UPI00260CE9B9|nr:OmpA family protein [uncultured Maribacter sp.]
MKKSIQAFIFAFALFIGVVSNSQDKRVTKADNEYEEYSFSPAIDIYKKVLDKGYVSADLLKNLGNSYYFNANYKQASDIYKRLIDDYGKDVGPEYFFRYAQTLKSLGDYEGSNTVMDKFSEITDNDVRANGFKEEKNYLKEIKKNSGRYTIKPFEYNTSYTEFAPSFYKEGLIFSSDRDTGNLARYRHTWNSKDFLDLYDTNDSSVVKLGKEVNTRLHESTSAITKDGSTLYFTRNNFKNGKYIKDDKGVIRLKIFKATYIDSTGVWSNIEELSINSDSYSVAHPALSNDESTLYFASDMPGTFGASDIYRVSIKEDGTLGAPENLGSNINTKARETFPFITNEDVLYMSSDGHPGLGGLDVFATNISNGKLNSSVVNVGEAVNSKMDDFTFIFNSETKKGYFASNREEGKGADDIYSFIENEPLLLDCHQAVTGTVRDKISNEVLVGAAIKIIDENNIEISSAITDSNGTYSIDLDCNQGNFVRAIMEGYVPAEEYLGKSDGKAKIIDFYLERDKVSGGYGDDLAKLLQLSTIYFNFDKYDIRKDSEIEVQKVIAAMEKYPSLKIKVNSHTDSRGKDSYNLWLSKKRAQATVDYMISKGISKDRLEGEGYGETKLINKCSNGVKCTGKEHELNRRSEFIILE